MGGFENSWNTTQEGLDQNHVLFGYRGTQMTIEQNQFHVPMQVDIGIGETRVSTTNIVSSTMRTQYVDRSRVGADLSVGDRINIDLYTLDPPDRFADSYFVIVRDADLTLRVVNNWILRPGGVYFNKDDFGSDVDWNKIISFTFGQQFSTNFGPPPLTYGVSRIEVVPEPGALMATVLGLLTVSRGRLLLPPHSAVTRSRLSQPQSVEAISPMLHLPTGAQRHPWLPMPTRCLVKKASTLWAMWCRAPESTECGGSQK